MRVLFMYCQRYAIPHRLCHSWVAILLRLWSYLFVYAYQVHGVADGIAQPLVKFSSVGMPPTVWPGTWINGYSNGCSFNWFHPCLQCHCHTFIQFLSFITVGAYVGGGPMFRRNLLPCLLAFWGNVHLKNISLNVLLLISADMLNVYLISKFLMLL